MFDMRFFKRNQKPFFDFAKEIYPGKFAPAPSHHFIRVLEEQGKLLRSVAAAASAQQVASQG